MSINKISFRCLLVSIILVLCLFAVWFGPKTELLYQEAVSNLARYQKTELFLSYAPVKEIKDNLIIVQQFASLVPIRLKTQDNKIKIDDFISFRGFLNDDLEIIVSDYHLHIGRDEKYWLSLLPLVA